MNASIAGGDYLRDGMAQAAAYIRQKATDYSRENCISEPDTGGVIYRRGELGEQYHHTLLDLADELEAIAPAPFAVIRGEVFQGPQDLCFAYSHLKTAHKELAKDVRGLIAYMDQRRGSVADESDRAAWMTVRSNLAALLPEDAALSDAAPEGAAPELSMSMFATRTDYEAAKQPAAPASGDGETIYVVRDSEGRIVDAYDREPDMTTYRGCNLYRYPALASPTGVDEIFTVLDEMLEFCQRYGGVSVARGAVYAITPPIPDWHNRIKLAALAAQDGGAST